MKLEQYKNKLNRSLGKQEMLISQKKDLAEKVSNLIKRKEAIEKATILVQRVALETQEQLKIQITDIVQSALDSCFGNVYTFQVDFEIKRGKTECNLRFFKGKFEIDPLTSDGGGLSDVISFALRIASWSLGTSAPVLILDESGKWLSRDLQPLFAELIKELSQRLHFQIIEVSHIPEMIESADKVFRVQLEQKDEWEISKVTEVG